MIFTKFHISIIFSIIFLHWTTFIKGKTQNDSSDLLKLVDYLTLYISANDSLVVVDEDVDHILNDVDSLKTPKENHQNLDSDQNVKIIDDAIHLFVDKDLKKSEEVIVLSKNENVSDTTTSSSSPAKPGQPQPACVSSNITLARLKNEVKLVNGSYLTRLLSDSGAQECFLVLFYVPWCPFSARIAPIFNAIPKAFLGLDILAFDVSKSIGYNTKFGTSAVPIVLLFQHKNVLAKFNYTDKNLTDFIEFVSLKTGWVDLD